MFLLYCFYIYSNTIILYIRNKKGWIVWINNRILLSSVTASLLLVSCPIAVIAADVTGIVYNGDANETNAVSVTLDDIDSDTRIAIDIQNAVNSDITISNSATLTVDSENENVFGINAQSSSDGTISNSGTIDLNATNNGAIGISINDVNNGTVVNIIDT